MKSADTVFYSGRKAGKRRGSGGKEFRILAQPLPIVCVKESLPLVPSSPEAARSPVIVVRDVCVKESPSVLS